jgi:hypothetical protein
VLSRRKNFPATFRRGRPEGEGREGSRQHNGDERERRVAAGGADEETTSEIGTIYKVREELAETVISSACPTAASIPLPNRSGNNSSTKHSD